MSKEEVENVIALKISDIKKEGFLVGLKSGYLSWTIGFETQKIGLIVFISESSSFARLIYSQTDLLGTITKFDYEISLAKTSCNYGGYRYWFLCGCGNRVGVLYSSGGYFACRNCCDLTYKSRNANRHYSLYPLIVRNKLLKKFNDLQPIVRTPYYAGRATKKQKQLERLSRIILNNGLP